ncbi:cbb3-type cytochrome c oxidase subunit I, partial [Bacillus vallismortis]|nr:cbb3-type cytochrome c oxidase subunit I [Bacillus vallismortis]
LLDGVHFWWPKIFGKILHETMGKISFVLFFIGFHLTFFIQHFVGLMGMPRRVYTFMPDQGLETGNLISTIGAFFMSAAVILLLVNVI